MQLVKLNSPSRADGSTGITRSAREGASVCVDEDVYCWLPLISSGDLGTNSLCCSTFYHWELYKVLINFLKPTGEWKERSYRGKAALKGKKKIQEALCCFRQSGTAVQRPPGFGAQRFYRRNVQSTAEDGTILLMHCLDQKSFPVKIQCFQHYFPTLWKLFPPSVTTPSIIAPLLSIFSLSKTTRFITPIKKLPSLFLCFETSLQTILIFRVTWRKMKVSKAEAFP